MIQARTGHSKDSVTTDIHGHAMSLAQELAVERIGELIPSIAAKIPGELE